MSTFTEAFESCHQQNVFIVKQYKPSVSEAGVTINTSEAFSHVAVRKSVVYAAVYRVFNVGLGPAAPAYIVTVINRGVANLGS